MPLQIIEFNDMLSLHNGVAQIPDGNPLTVSAADFTGIHTVSTKARMVKIKGTGTIVWAGGQTAEEFDGIEFRGVKAGNTFTVA